LTTVAAAHSSIVSNAEANATDTMHRLLHVQNPNSNLQQSANTQDKNQNTQSNNQSVMMIDGVDVL
jgi:hypothetical protein